MNFAYLDARTLLESVLQEPEEPPLDPLPWVLTEDWKKFEEILDKFKLQYSIKRRDLSAKLAELDDKRKDVKLLNCALDSVSNIDLKVRVKSILDSYESDEGISVLTQQCRELMGKVNEMQRVLINTMSERYASFTCFICTERLVDLFIDPCGHVVCTPCWVRSAARQADGPRCPGCRTQVSHVKKIYTM
jgi:hypothetical protein